MGKPEFVITEETGRTLREWAESGTDLIGEKQTILRELLDHDVITPAEKDKALEAINTYTVEVLDKKIAGIKKLIADREAKVSEAAELALKDPENEAA